MSCSVCACVGEREIWARGSQAGAMTAGLGCLNRGGGRERSKD